MTDGEWGLFTALLEAEFRGGLTEDRDAALRLHFGAVPFEWAQPVVENLVMRGQVFVPVSAELVAALRRVVGNGWHMRRILAGRSVAEQQEVDAQAAAASASLHERRLLAEGVTDDPA